MNILLFVTTMIMVMAMLTYGRIESYRSFSMIQSHFKNYIDSTERGYINQLSDNLFENSKGETETKPPGTGKKGGGGKQTDASPSINFSVFIDKSKRESMVKEYPKIHLMTKKLIYNLFKDQPFFKKMEQKRPDFVDAMLNAIQGAADALPKKEKLKKADELIRLDLGDEELNQTLYQMLAKTRNRPPEKNEKIDEDKPTAPLTEEDKGENDNAEFMEYNENMSLTPPGTFSLLNYINYPNAKRKVRVYLAPRKVLQAIFDDPTTVNSIITTRNDLYKSVKDGPLSNDQASESFKRQFASMADPNFDDSILDFTVTKTNPKLYEQPK